MMSGYKGFNKIMRYNIVNFGKNQIFFIKHRYLPGREMKFVLFSFFISYTKKKKNI